MPIVLATLLPDIALIALGGVMTRWTGRDLWRGIDRLNFGLLLPALLFVAASRQQVTLAALGAIGVAAWSLILIGLALGALRRPPPGKARLDFAGQWQTCYRQSTPLAFVAAAAFPPAVQGLIGVAVGAWVPFANFVAVMALSRGSGLGVGRAVLRALTNPFFVTSLAGLAVAIGQIPVPDLLMRALHRLSDAAIPMALLSMGATMNWRAFAKPSMAELSLISIKLIGLPCCALLMAVGFGLDPVQSAVLVLMAALPTAPTAHVLAASFGADPRPTATIIAQGTVLAIVTLPIWMSIALQM